MKAWHNLVTPVACFLGLICAAFIQDLLSGPSRYSVWQWMPVSLIALIIPPVIVLAWCLIQDPRPSPVVGFLVSAGTFALVEILDMAFGLHAGIIAGLFSFLPLLILMVFDVVRRRS